MADAATPTERSIVVARLAPRASPQSCKRRGAGTIGNFDGVHRGHQAVLGEARRIAEAEGLRSGAVLFSLIRASSSSLTSLSSA